MNRGHNDPPVDQIYNLDAPNSPKNWGTGPNGTNICVLQTNSLIPLVWIGWVLYDLKYVGTLTQYKKTRTFTCYCFSSGGDAVGNRFGPGSENMPTWMDDMRCEGEELSLFSCPFSGWGNEDCSHGEDISVICDSGEQTTTPRSQTAG